MTSSPDFYLAVQSENENPNIVDYCCQSVKDCILEGWKNGTGVAGKWHPAFRKEPPIESLEPIPTPPELKVCVREKNQLVIPQNLRQRWLKCPVRSVLLALVHCFICFFLGGNSCSGPRPGLA
ncbi:unnamed protein product [Symbiodinium natans]|uniref:Uncharacterized protein n=1 Tax=Symbiodinium natans TaxID=878477 RepID=A0A812LTW5_9DINO|nr:unnamed protein product [Symbiodinium natans]